MLVPGATEAAIAAETAKLTKLATSYQNPLVNIAYTTLEPLPVVLLFGFVSAGMLSRKAKSSA